MVALLFVIAFPFFSLWAGPDFGRESTVPFYVLLVGLLFNVISYVPYSSLVASGRTDIIAKLNWFELVPYLMLVVFLITKLGIVGAALAWTLRVTFDSFVLLALSSRRVGGYSDFKRYVAPMFLGALFLSPSIAAVVLSNDSWMLAIVLLLPTLLIYAFWTWKKAINVDERTWIFGQVTGFLRFTR
jgi:O-antigen/teichoic acid export membrane protein